MSIHIKSQWDDDAVRLTLRIEHPMETGTQVDGTGVVIPAWYLKSLDVFVDDAPVASFVLSSGMAKNPIVSLSLMDVEAGQTVRAIWHDNRGGSRERSHRLQAPTD